MVAIVVLAALGLVEAEPPGCSSVGSTTVAGRMIGVGGWSGGAVVAAAAVDGLAALALAFPASDPAAAAAAGAPLPVSGFRRFAA